VQGDAHALPFEDDTYDTVVCTFGLCAIPDLDRAIAEMHRVLRPGGRLVLVDHVAGSARPLRMLQRLLPVIRASASSRIPPGVCACAWMAPTRWE